MIMKGDTVFYYADGQITYEDAQPGIVLEHNDDSTIVDIRLCGTDRIVRSVKNYEHRDFRTFPHLRMRDGCWGERPKKRPEPKKKPSPAPLREHPELESEPAA